MGPLLLPPRGIENMMDEKYKEKPRSADKPYATAARQGEFTDEWSAYQRFLGSNVDSANYVDKNHDSKSPGRFNGRSNKSSTDQADKTVKPCFAMQRNGKCDFPNCKYSHDPKVIARAPPPPEKGSQIAMLLDDIADKSLVFSAQALALAKTKQKLRAYKKLYKKNGGGKKISGNGSKADGNGSTYQGVVKGTAQTHAAISTQPDGSSDRRTMFETDDEDHTSDNLYSENDNDSEAESIDDTESQE